MNTNITPVTLRTPTRTRRGLLGIVMLLGLTCCRATGALAIEEPQPTSAALMAVAEIDKSALPESKPPAGDTSTDPLPGSKPVPSPEVKSPGGGTDEPPGELPDIIVDDPGDDDDARA